MREWLRRLGRELSELPRNILKIVVVMGRLAISRPRVTIAIIVTLVIFGLGVFWFASITANRALAEERAFWIEASRLSSDERTMIKNDMVRTGRVPHLLPWWEMDQDRCAAVVWKLTNLITGVPLTHGDNGAAWNLRKQNSGKLRTVWDVTHRFDSKGRLNDQLEPTIVELRAFLDGLDPKGVYLIGFRYTSTLVGSKIRRDNADINSHVVMMTDLVFFHMFRYGNDEDPVVADFQERFFSYNKGMQPVWVAQVIQNGKPFRFTNSDRKFPMQQRVYPWKSLRWFLMIPDWSRGVNAIERALLFWFRNGYDMYPRLPS